MCEPGTVQPIEQKRAGPSTKPSASAQLAVFGCSGKIGGTGIDDVVLLTCRVPVRFDPASNFPAARVLKRSE